MSLAIPAAFLGVKEAVQLDVETHPKFLNLKVFWIRLTDFMDIVPRYAHLSGIPLPTRAMVLNDVAF